MSRKISYSIDRAVVKQLAAKARASKFYEEDEDGLMRFASLIVGRMHRLYDRDRRRALRRDIAESGGLQ